VQAAHAAINIHDSAGIGSPTPAEPKIIKMKYDRLIEGLADQIGHRPTDRNLLETARIKRAAKIILRGKRNRYAVRTRAMVQLSKVQRTKL
jgi:retron-type reverse transcriptase